MEVHLYDRNLTSPTYQENLTGRVQGLRFSTRLHGGFHRCSWRHRADLPESWEWLRRRQGFRVVIEDRKAILWEGRIEDVEISEGAVDITAYGYYASLTDQMESTAFSGSTDTTIKAALTAHAPMISTDQTKIAATGVTIPSTAADGYNDLTIQELIEKLLESGNTSDQRMYFAIWENRVAYLTARSAASIDWYCSLGNFTRLRLKYVLGDLYNRVYARYQSGGSLTRTAEADDTDSQTKHGDGTTGLIRAYAIPDMGAVAAAAAQQARDTWLQQHKDIWPRLTGMVLGEAVYDSNRAWCSSAHIRAGDVLRITDLVPVSADAGSVALDALRTFYLTETEYDLDTRTMRITPDTARSSLDQLLAKKITR